MKALDLAKDSLPDEVMLVTDSHLFAARLPVCLAPNLLVF